MIQSLIDKQDTSELIRDQIAGILTSEVASQQSLATAGGKDPRRWALNIYTDRANPWSDFQDPPSEQVDIVPIVNIWQPSASVEGGSSNPVERQGYAGIWNVDCYGCGISAADGAGHIPGDVKARMEAQRAARLVRNVLASSEYVYLGLRGLVGKRVVGSITTQESDPAAIQHIAALRLNLEVRYSEYSPQHEPETLDRVVLTVTRDETGLIAFVGDYQ